MLTLRDPSGRVLSQHRLDGGLQVNQDSSLLPESAATALMNVDLSKGTLKARAGRVRHSAPHANMSGAARALATYTDSYDTLGATRFIGVVGTGLWASATSDQTWTTATQFDTTVAAGVTPRLAQVGRDMYLLDGGYVKRFMNEREYNLAVEAPVTGLSAPWGMDFDDENTLAVAIRGSDTVKLYDTVGTTLATYTTQLNDPVAVALTADYVYVLNAGVVHTDKYVTKIARSDASTTGILVSGGLATRAWLWVSTSTSDGPGWFQWTGFCVQAITTGTNGNSLSFKMITGASESIAVSGNDITLTVVSGVSTPLSVQTLVNGDPIASTIVEVHSPSPKNYKIEKPYPKTYLSGGLEGGISNASSIAYGTDGNLWIADTDNSRIAVFSTAGTYVKQIVTTAKPTALALDGTSVYVGCADNRVYKYTASSGALTATWGGTGTKPGEFTTITALYYAPTGNVVVVDMGGHRVQEFSSIGAFVQTLGTRGNAVGELTNPRGVAVDTSGAVWVADTDNGRIQRFFPTAVATAVVRELTNEPCPPTAPTVTQNTGTPAITVGTYEFCYSYAIRRADGTYDEGPTSAVTTSVLAAATVRDFTVTVTLLPGVLTGDDQVYLYTRHTGSGEYFRRIAAAGVTVGASSQSFTTTAAILAEQATLTAYVGRPPFGCSLMTPYSSRMLYAKGDTLYISNLLAPDRVPSLRYQYTAVDAGGFAQVGTDGQDIIGLAVWQDQVLAMKRTWVARMVGFEANDPQSLPVLDGVGCSAPNTIAEAEGRLLWLDGEHLWSYGADGAVDIGEAISPLLRSYTEAQQQSAFAYYDPYRRWYVLTFPRAGSVISTAVRSSNVVTVTTSAAHGLTVGTWVNVTGMTTADMRGLVQVATVADSTHFTYASTGPDASATGGVVTGSDAYIFSLITKTWWGTFTGQPGVAAVIARTAAVGGVYAVDGVDGTLYRMHTGTTDIGTSGDGYAIPGHWIGRQEGAGYGYITIPKVKVEGSATVAFGTVQVGMAANGATPTMTTSLAIPSAPGIPPVATWRPAPLRDAHTVTMGVGWSSTTGGEITRLSLDVLPRVAR